MSRNADTFQSPGRMMPKSPFLPGGITTPSPARHDAAATMMSLLHVRTVDDTTVEHESDPMSPPQMRVLKRGRGDLASQGLLHDRVRKAPRKIVDHGMATASAQPDVKAAPAPSGRARKGRGAANEYSRKDKSLGLLCEKFLAYYGAGEHSAVCLDVAADKLGVERRRIYDIVNILESVGIVARVAKNRYDWMGTQGLPATLRQMQLSAARDADFVEAIQQTQAECVEGAGGATTGAARDAQAALVMARSLSVDSAASGDSAGPSAMVAGGAPAPATKRGGVAAKKDRSLGGLSERFVQIFLLGLGTCTLEQVARILLGEDCSASRLKTKVRRLYDIANVLCSLQLVEKVYLSRKPAFQWRGASGVPLLPSPIASAGVRRAPTTKRIARASRKEARITRRVSPDAASPASVPGGSQSTAPNSASSAGSAGSAPMAAKRLASLGQALTSPSPVGRKAEGSTPRSAPGSTVMYPTPVVSNLMSPRDTSSPAMPTPLAQPGGESKAAALASVGRKLPMTTHPYTAKPEVLEGKVKPVTERRRMETSGDSPGPAAATAQ